VDFSWDNGSSARDRQEIPKILEHPSQLIFFYPPLSLRYCNLTLKLGYGKKEKRDCFREHRWLLTERFRGSRPFIGFVDAKIVGDLD
jgi:hypothetical protein